ncbi:MAG: RHS repeat-associated core domain-containing protein, partial [Myxococcota bacterium]
YYHRDHLGGPAHVTDTQGTLVAYTVWHPYGLEYVKRGLQPNHTFTGAEREPESELGLIQMGARWYAPKIGRWVSADPLFVQAPKKSIESPLELSLYSYATNSPLNATDPSGLEPGRADERDVEALVAGDISKEQLSDRRAARAGGAAVGLAVVGIGLVAVETGPAVLTAATGVVQQGKEIVQRAASAITGAGSRLMQGASRLADRVGQLFSRGGQQAAQAVEQSASRVTPEMQRMLDAMSGSNLKHSVSHLAEFQNLDPTMTGTALRELGARIATNQQNLISGANAAQKAFQAVVRVGEESVTIRAVLNRVGNLHSIHIRR